MNRRVLVSGANGFIGRAVFKRLASEGFAPVGAVRKEPLSPGLVIGPSLLPSADWSPLLVGIDTVIHTAARVHVMSESSSQPLAEFRKVNVDGTARLARQAAAAGVRRFIFLSTVKVNGEGTQVGHPFTADDLPAPEDDYGISKLEAETCLRTVAVGTGMQVVVIRPPLVYGPGVGANFLSMMRWLDKGVPLPLGGILYNRRSLVMLDNLVDLLIRCIDHPAAANQTFLASDGEDMSTTQLLLRMGGAMGKPARLFPLPVQFLEFAAATFGKRSLAKRICGSLQVDISKTCKMLDWVPPVSVEEGFRRTAAGVNSLRERCEGHDIPTR